MEQEQTPEPNAEGLDPFHLQEISYYNASARNKQHSVRSFAEIRVLKGKYFQDPLSVTLA